MAGTLQKKVPNLVVAAMTWHGTMSRTSPWDFGPSSAELPTMPPHPPESPCSRQHSLGALAAVAAMPCVTNMLDSNYQAQEAEHRARASYM